MVVHLYKVSKDELKQKIAEDFDIPLDKINDEFLKFLEKFIESKASSTEYLIKKIEVPAVQLPPDVQPLLVPKIYYFINVKKTTWMAIGLLLDIFITKGVATAFLSSLGIIGQSIAKLNLRNGEVCCYYQALFLKRDGVKKFTENQIFKKVYKKTCFNPNFNCIYNNHGICSISAKDLKRIIKNLKDKSVISKTEDNKWRVEL